MAICLWIRRKGRHGFAQTSRSTHCHLGSRHLLSQKTDIFADLTSSCAWTFEVGGGGCNATVKQKTTQCFSPVISDGQESTEVTVNAEATENPESAGEKWGLQIRLKLKGNHLPYGESVREVGELLFDSEPATEGEASPNKNLVSILKTPPGGNSTQCEKRPEVPEPVQVVHVYKWACPQCEVTFRSKIELIAHATACPLQIWMCYFCRKSFNTKRSLSLHMDTHTSEIQKSLKPEVQKVVRTQLVEKYRWLCSLCNQEFAEKVLLEDHSKYRHAGQFVCHFCDTVFRDKERIAAHLKTHMANNSQANVVILKQPPKRTAEEIAAGRARKRFKVSGPLFCDICGEMFNEEPDWLQHRAGAHVSSCRYCDRQVSLYDMEKHIQSRHPLGKHQCRLCGRRFNDALSKRNHLTKCLRAPKMQTADMGDDDTDEACDETTEAYPIDRWPIETSEANEDEEEEIAEPRGKGMIRRNVPKRNKKRAKIPAVLLEDDHRCDYCHEQFSSLRQKRIHTRKAHRNEYRNAGVQCELCLTELKNEERYQAHKAEVHGIDGNHACPVCDKQFLMASRMKEHMSVHIATLDFSCRFCDKKFKTNQAMRRHTFSVHSVRLPREKPTSRASASSFSVTPHRRSTTFTSVPRKVSCQPRGATARPITGTPAVQLPGAVKKKVIVLRAPPGVTAAPGKPLRVVVQGTEDIR